MLISFCQKAIFKGLAFSVTIIVLRRLCVRDTFKCWSVFPHPHWQIYRVYIYITELLFVQVSFLYVIVHYVNEAQSHRHSVLIDWGSCDKKTLLLSSILEHPSVDFNNTQLSHKQVVPYALVSVVKASCQQ